MNKTKSVRAIAIAGAIFGFGLLGTPIATADAPVPTPEPGGVIRMDTTPGEWWECTGWSLQPPFWQQAPGIHQFALGPDPVYLRFSPGADVWVECAGTGSPFIYYGPIVKAGS
ncbi:hypothetical protein GPX89_23475 [Nocardia sp. ET3-3]|uniref:Secreted protein n=1 Tax=Nocardia terrae TaxID=2675851 RepID=A0A7K1V0N3_9NOCA|nr:hypothetical protein [Nocardia terrae]MVU80193.1 hypothetical protein [Nocardia terrae]